MASNEFVTYLLEMMAPWAKVTARRMFGGQGLYRDGTMFALVANDALYFKVDEPTRAHFAQIGSAPMIYRARERTIPMSYWSAPAGALETPGEMAHWCGLAYGAALRFAANKKSKKRQTPGVAAPATTYTSNGQSGVRATTSPATTRRRAKAPARGTRGTRR